MSQASSLPAVECPFIPVVQLVELVSDEQELDVEVDLGHNYSHGGPIIGQRQTEAV